MPTYQYRCATCEHQFEQFQRFADAPLTECPDCNGAVRRVISPVGVVFKGSGWYITDSRKGAAKSESEGDKAELTKAEKSGTSEKSAAKAETPSSTPPETTKPSKPAAKDHAGTAAN